MDGQPRAPIEGMCEGVTAAGEPCAAFARRGTSYCWQHDPETAAARETFYGGRESDPEGCGTAILPRLGGLRTAEEVIDLQRQLVTYLATAPKVEPRRATALRGAIADLKTAIALQEQLAAAEAEGARLKQALQQAEEEIARLRSQRETDRKEKQQLYERLQRLGGIEKDQYGVGRRG